MSTKNKSNKSSSYFRYILLCVVVLFFVIYAVVTLASLYSQIGDKKAELQQINNKISIQEIKNGEMNKLYNSSDEEFSEYIEQIAREDLDYIRQGERVFVNVSGD
mgnify:CR=1 FL=1